MDLLTWPDGPENPKIFKRFYSERAYEWHYGVNPVIRLKANPLVPLAPVMLAALASQVKRGSRRHRVEQPQRNRSRHYKDDG